MKVVLSELANRKLKYYIDNIDYEISGLGLVEKREDGSLYVPDIFLLTQEVSGAETDLDPAAVAKFLDDKLQEKIIVDGEEVDFPVENIKLWWHSHVNMGVFWSGTDSATCNRLDNESPEENWYLSIVGNKRGDRLARVDVFQPHRMWQNEVRIEVEALDPDPLIAEIQAEIEEKVTIRTLQVQSAGQAAKNIVNQVFNGKKELDGWENRNGIYLPKKGKKFKKGKHRRH